MMLLHAIVIAVILYLIMVFFLNQSSIKAENRSALIGAIIFIYMLLFGHDLPKIMNEHL